MGNYIDPPKAQNAERGITMKQYNYHMLSMPYANCRVEFIVDDFSCLRNIRLRSYSTLILDAAVGVLKNGQAVDVKVLCPVDCSRTTARHVNRFTTELFGKNMYFDFKTMDEGESITVDDMLLNAVEMFEHYVNYGKVIC